MSHRCSRLLNHALAEYQERRGERISNHRRTALGEVSGADRYEVLKRAGAGQELCGVSADEKSLEVDHILLRRHGGTDDRANLQQALCWKCNANLFEPEQRATNLLLDQVRDDILAVDKNS